MSEKKGTTLKKHPCDVLYCIYVGSEKCGGCRRAYYCSTKCQEIDRPTHKYLCRHPEENVVVDGNKLCNTILKCNDGVHTYLAGKVFDRVDKEENDITIHTKSNQENDPFKLVDTPLLFLENGHVEEDGLKAYWAIRSITSGFVLNAAFFMLLEKYRDSGYTTVIFNKEEIPLEGLSLDIIRVAPHINVRIQEASQNTPKLTTSLISVVSIGEFSMTLSSGEFWKFDDNFGFRPTLLEKSDKFLESIGRLVSGEQEKAKKRMFAKTDVCNRLASLLYLATQHLDITFDMSANQHLKGAIIELQADKLRSARMLSNAGFEKTMTEFINKAETPLTQNLTVLADFCAKSGEEIAKHTQ